MSGPSGNVHGTGDFDFKSFFLDIPPVTRSIFITMFTCTVLSGVGVLPIHLFVLDWYPIVQKFQVWRLVFTFCHAGRMGITFLIRMYFLYVYSQQLENGVFFGRTANYAWFLTIVSAFVIAGSTIVTSYINGAAYLLAIIHLWGRHANNVTVTMYGFIRIPAKYLSLTMLALDVIINQGVNMADVLGLLGGHLYYFLDSVYPAMHAGKQLIFVPIWFENFIHQTSSFLASTTGLQRGPPVAPPGGSRTGFRSGTSGPAGGSSGSTANRSGSTDFRSGFTNPSARTRHVWGRGHALGS